MDFNIINILLLLAWILSGMKLLDEINTRQKKNAAIFGDADMTGREWLVLFLGPAFFIYGHLKALAGDRLGAFLKDVRRRSRSLNIEIFDSRGIPMFGSDCNNPAIDELKEMILTAVNRGGSDIFLDPAGAGQYALRMRIDGSLVVIKNMTSDFGDNVVNAIKVAAGMDISEKRRPQDGSFSAGHPGGNVAFRVATVGAFGGEKVAIRLLGTAAGPKSLEEIGFSGGQLEVLKNAVSLSSGMILMCGGTGSGKTTTLYALIDNIDYSLKNVISIEDPVERVLPRVSQMEVNVKAGITFADILRNALRQNPDVICLGEIRDEETAEIAVHAAQTGHLIISTVHSNDAVDTIDRLGSLGVPLRSLAATVKVIVNQRLARRLCPSCKKPAENVPDDWMRYFEANNIPVTGVYQAVGCPECSNTGYRGRVACLDVLVLDQTIRAEMEKENVSLTRIKELVSGSTGNRSMLYHGAVLAASGVSSLEEISRITLSIDGGVK